MCLTTARSVLRTMNSNVDVPHPQAKEGNLHDYKRANDKSRGRMIVHYATRNGLFFVSLSKETTRLVA